ncbi:hypothetical protein NDU88_005240 [Pleurodeles waltl]|uniref:Uncharacterized protein n=1 Tax=Pleurodeles waltl TaxID=8319 RepID=A0AAV7TTP9_PLEWA|nr:hypothetical protein NDU88_005240 [Pleurodeles waltl]
MLGLRSPSRRRDSQVSATHLFRGRACRLLSVYCSPQLPQVLPRVVADFRLVLWKRAERSAERATGGFSSIYSHCAVEPRSTRRPPSCFAVLAAMFLGVRLCRDPERRLPGSNIYSEAAGRGHHTFGCICGSFGAIWVIVNPRVGREEREPHREAATAITPSHASLGICFSCMLTLGALHRMMSSSA